MARAKGRRDRRDQRHQPVKVNGGIPGQVERHDEDADRLDDQLDAPFEVGHQGAPQHSKHLVERGREQARARLLRSRPGAGPGCCGRGG